MANVKKGWLPVLERSVNINIDSLLLDAIKVAKMCPPLPLHQFCSCLLYSQHPGGTTICYLNEEVQGAGPFKNAPLSLLFAHLLSIDLVAATSMTSIPQEIIDLIAPHLNQHDLADCSRVCHDWSSLFSPGLWRSINIANQSTHDRFNTPESRAALIRNKHLVREVTATDQDLLLLLAAHDHSEPSLPKLTGLRSLTLCFYADAPWALTMGTTPQEDENEGEDEVTVTATEALVAMTVRLARVDNFRALLELLSNNTNLRNLRLKKGCLRGADRTELLLHIMEACATTSLTTLEVCLNDVPKYPPKPSPDLPPTPHTLKTTNRFGWQLGTTRTRGSSSP